MIEEAMGQKIMRLLCEEIIDRLADPLIRKEMKPAEMEMIRKLLSDNMVTIASVQRGDFGELAKEIAESHPFSGEEDESGRVFQ